MTRLEDVINETCSECENVTGSQKCVNANLCGCELRTSQGLSLDVNLSKYCQSMSIVELSCDK